MQKWICIVNHCFQKHGVVSQLIEILTPNCLEKFFKKDLDKIRSGAEKDPFSNSITMLALDISRRLEKNLLNYSALEALIQRLAVGSLGFRADRLKSYMGSVCPEFNKKAISNILNKLAFDKDKKISLKNLILYSKKRFWNCTYSTSYIWNDL